MQTNPGSKPTRGSIDQTKMAPALRKSLFWDMLFERIDWQGDHVTIIGRVLERGTREEIAEMVRFYGLNRVLQTLRSELTYLPEYVIPEVCEYFKLKRAELRCYMRPPWRKGHWI